MCEFVDRSSCHPLNAYALRSTCRHRSLPALSPTGEEHEYREMERSFSASGGIVSSDDVVSLLIRHTGQPISQLARWIVNHDVLSFQWRSRMVLPLFQFDLSSMTLRTPLTAVVHELFPALTDWDICVWFAKPSPWLADATPLDAMETNAPAVLEAARSERFLVRG